MSGDINGRHRQTYPTTPSDPVGTSNPSDKRTNSQVTISWDGAQYPIQAARVRAGEIIGYRAWRFREDGLLHSMYVDYTWEPQKIHAFNQSLLSFGTGFHAYKNLEKVYERYLCFRVIDKIVFGTIAMWGDIIEHEYGYRSEYAAIKSLISCHSWLNLFPNQSRKHWYQIWRPNTMPRLREKYKINEGMSTT